MTDDREPQDWFGSKAPNQGDAQPQPGWQPQSAWQSPPPMPVQQAGAGSSRRRWTGVGLVAAGLVAGGVMAGTLGASAATSGTSGAASYSTGGSTSSTVTHPDGDRGHGLDLSGTVTAVGTSSVTIKTASGTSTYAVTSTSDIDKDGESQLSKLAAGDAVRFSTTTSGTTVTIDKLHAGNEALNGPQGGPEAG